MPLKLQAKNETKAKCLLVMQCLWLSCMNCTSDMSPDWLNDIEATRECDGHFRNFTFSTITTGGSTWPSSQTFLMILRSRENVMATPEPWLYSAINTGGSFWLNLTTSLDWLDDIKVKRECDGHFRTFPFFCYNHWRLILTQLDLVLKVIVMREVPKASHTQLSCRGMQIVSQQPHHCM